MREITYSQGLIIQDPILVATLSVFCAKVWLPYSEVGDAVQEALISEGALPQAIEALRTDPTRQKVAAWEADYAPLFECGALARLSGPRHGPHEHRHEFDDRSVAEIVGEERPIYERLGLRYHFTRADLPGVEFFDAGHPRNQVDLAAALFHLELPKITAHPAAI